MEIVLALLILANFVQLVMIRSMERHQKIIYSVLSLLITPKEIEEKLKVLKNA